MRNMKHKAR